MEKAETITGSKFFRRIKLKTMWICIFLIFLNAESELIKQSNEILKRVNQTDGDGKLNWRILGFFEEKMVKFLLFTKKK